MSTPTEVKAQAIALLVLGRSCREAQAELRQQFPDAEIPHYSTIARWFQKLVEPQTKRATVYWSVLAESVAKALFRRTDEAEGMSLMELVELSSRVSDIYQAMRERQMAARACRGSGGLPIWKPRQRASKWTKKALG